MFELLPLPAGLHPLHPAVLVPTWFGSGLVVPLRAGLAVASVLLLVTLVPPKLGRTVILVLLVVLVPAALWTVDVWTRHSGVADDRRIVVDEVIGFLVALVVLSPVRPWLAVLAAPLFLGLDRWKPWPLDRLEVIPGGTGVLLDDVAAGAGVGLVLAAVRWALSACER